MQPRLTTSTTTSRPAPDTTDSPGDQPAPGRQRLGPWAVVAVVVLAFTGAWIGGDLVLDGPGHTLWVRLALDHWQSGGIPWWFSEMWAGTPVWGLAPSFPILNLVPLAALVGPETAVKAAAIAAQVAAGWGVMVLARSFWGKTAPAVVAGIVYALHPTVVTHGALWGEQQVLGVMAATPWLIWALLHALRGRGRRWVAVAGLLSGFTVMQQAEYVYGPLLVCGFVVVAELARAARAGGLERVRAFLGRAAAVGAIATGLAAYWLLPFAKLSKSFVLTPPGWVRSSLTGAVGTRVGDPSLFLSRPVDLASPLTFKTVDAFSSGIFYMGWVCIVLTGATAVLLAGRRSDRTVSAILLGCWLALWSSIGGVALSSRASGAGGIALLAAVGIFSGLLAGAFIRNLRLGRAAAGAAVVVVLALFAAPYVAPFLAAQAVVPLLQTVRFPRVFAVAPLGVALGTAYPLTVIPAWLAHRRATGASRVSRWEPGRVMAVASVAVIVAFVVDVLPTRSFYFLHPPNTSDAYARVTATLAANGDDYRVWSSIDPRIVDAVLRTGRELSTGWPHPLASPGVLHLDYEASLAPFGYRDAALALSGTGHVVFDPSDDPFRGTAGASKETLDAVTVFRNPKVLPLVRAYDEAVVVDDGDVAPDLAVTLAQRNIGVVEGGGPEARSLRGITRGVVRRKDACRLPVVERAGTGDIAAEADAVLSATLASACSIHNWVGNFARLGTVSTGRAAGGVFRPPFDGLTAISVWLDRVSPGTVLIVRELGADGRTLGPPVSSALSSGYDENEMSIFPVAPGAAVKGKNYVFLLACPSCGANDQPRMVDAEPRGHGTLVSDGGLRDDLAAAFVLQYQLLTPAPQTSTKLDVTREGGGTWHVRSTGDKSSLVVVAASWFPGWEARVDGKPARVLKADGAFVGAAVPAGSHDITFRYKRPSTVVIGRLISVATLAIAIALLLPARRRRRARQRLPAEVP